MTQPAGSRRPSLPDGASQAPAKKPDAGGPGEPVRAGALGQHAVSQLPAAGGVAKPQAPLPDPDSKSFAGRKAQLPMPAGSPPTLKAKDLAVLMSDMTAVYKVVGQHKEAVARQKLEAIFDGVIAKFRKLHGDGFSAPAVVAALFTQVEAMRAGAREAGGKPWSWDEAVTVYRAAIASVSKALGADPGPRLLPLVWVRDGNPNAMGQALFLEVAKGGSGAAPLLAEGLASLAQAAQAQDLPGEYLSEAAASLVRGFAAVVPPPDGKAQGARLAASRGHEAAATSLLTAARSLGPAQLERLSMGLAKGWDSVKSGASYSDTLLSNLMTESAFQELDASCVCAIVRGWQYGSLTGPTDTVRTPAQALSARKVVRQRLLDALDNALGLLNSAPYVETGRKLQALADELKPPLAGGISSSSSSSSADPKR